MPVVPVSATWLVVVWFGCGGWCCLLVLLVGSEVWQLGVDRIVWWGRFWIAGGVGRRWIAWAFVCVCMAHCVGGEEVVHEI